VADSRFEIGDYPLGRQLEDLAKNGRGVVLGTTSLGRLSVKLLLLSGLW